MRAVVAFACLLVAGPAPAQYRDDARPRDLQRLQEELQNLDEVLQGLEPDDPKTDTFRQRAEEMREDTIYLKVKMRRHQRGGREGTGVSYDEVEQLRASVAELREDIDRSFRGADAARETRIPEGTQLSLRLEEALSSKTARREDRFEASVVQPLAVGGALVVPAGTRVRGVVRAVEPAQRPNKAGQLELDFHALYLERERFDIVGRVVGVEAERDGRADTAGKAGIGAVLGGVLGGILGGSRGAVLGVILGGTGAVVGTRGEEVELPAGTLLTLRLDRELVLPPR